MRKAVTGFLLLAFVAGSGFAQTVKITGRVTDPSGKGIPNTVVRMGVQALFAETNTEGYYALGSGTVPVRRNVTIKGTAFEKPHFSSGRLLFSLPENNSQVRISLFDMSGQFVKDVLNSTLGRGNYSYLVDDRNLSSQFYVLRVSINNVATVLKAPSLGNKFSGARALQAGASQQGLEKLAAASDTLHATAPGYSIGIKPIESLEGTYDFQLTKVTTWDGNINAFWGDTSKIPKVAGGIIFKIINRTNGVYADSQIYWAVGDNGASNRLSDLSTINLANNSSGRIYVMLGKSGRGANTYWDFEEHTTGNGVYNGNTTRVDAFRLPLAIRLHCADGHDTTLGEEYFVFYQSRQSRFDEFINEATPEFTHLAQAPYAPYMIMAPRGEKEFVSGKFKDYYTAYVNQVWSANLRNKFAAYAKPTTDNIFSCTGAACGGHADIAAILNRHVAEDTLNWDERKTGAAYYQKTPCNYYSRFMHRRSMKNRCYGFPYDDWAFWAAYDSHGGAQWLVIAVGF